MDNSKGNVEDIVDTAAWEAKVAEANDSGKIIVVKFTATWCGYSCQTMASFFATLSMKYDNLLFLAADVDDLEEVVSELGVGAMPSFLFVEDGNKVDEVVGVKKAELEQTCIQYN